MTISLQFSKINIIQNSFPEKIQDTQETRNTCMWYLTRLLEGLKYGGMEKFFCGVKKNDIFFLVFFGTYFSPLVRVLKKNGRFAIFVKIPAIFVTY